MNFRRRRPREDDPTTWGYRWARRTPMIEERVPMQFHGGERTKIVRPFAIECRWIAWVSWNPEGARWRAYNHYRSERERDEALRTLQRKGYDFIEYRAA